MKNDVYQIVTDRIIELLEKEIVPWHKPWSADEGFPRNLSSGKEYRGLNVFMLAAQRYGSPYWLTYKQAAERGGTVRKGEKSTLVVFWKWLDRIDEKTGEQKKVPMLRYYNVFNVEQTEGIEYPKPEPKLPDFSPIAEAERIVAEMPNAPRITHEQQRAFYRRDIDAVNMPGRETFDTEPSYYSTLFHELTHSTGHESRLGRLQDSKSGFGSTDYAKEELIAEMGASFLCGKTGIENATIEASANYIQNWLKALRNDRKLVVHAAAAAQKAVDYITGATFGESKEVAQP